MSSDAQLLLRSAGDEFVRWLPPGYQAEGSGGKGNGAISPWIAVFDLDETVTARRGMYVVYLFSADLRTVALSLNQGVTEIGAKLGRPAARVALQKEAAHIRASFRPAAIGDLDATIDLKTRADLPVDYEYGNIVARTYDLADLPHDDTLIMELHRFLRLYARALEARTEGRQRGDASIVTTSPTPTVMKDDGEFKPKSEADYRQMVVARELIKSRKHEVLVNSYKDFLEDRRFVVRSPHPRDMTADRDGRHWLFEAKTVGANAEHAARAAFAQLYFYARFLYEPGLEVNKAALFNESVGPLYVDFFTELEIAVVWRGGDKWHGSHLAQEAGLC